MMNEHHDRTCVLMCRLALLLAFVAALLAPAALWAVTGAEGVQSLGGGRYMIGEIRSVPAKGLSGLRLTGPPNLSGQVIVTTAKTDSVKTTISKILRVGSIEIASELDAEIQVALRPVGSVLMIDVQTPRGARWEGTNWGVNLEMMIELPPGWDLDVDTRHFEFDLEGPFRDVSIRTEFGRVKVKNVEHRLDVRGNYTGVEIEDVRGSITGRTAYSDITVRRAIPAADEPVRLMNSYGPIIVEDLVGSLIAETQSSSFELSGISLVGGTSRIVGENSSVELQLKEFGQARLEIETSHSPVELDVPRHLSAQLSLAVGTGGSIHTTGLTIKTHKGLLSRKRIEGVCGAGVGIIDVSCTGASSVELVGR